MTNKYHVETPDLLASVMVDAVVGGYHVYVTAYNGGYPRDREGLRQELAVRAAARGYVPCEVYLRPCADDGYYPPDPKEYPAF